MKTLTDRNTSQKVTFSVNVISFEVLLMHSDYLYFNRTGKRRSVVI